MTVKEFIEKLHNKSKYSFYVNDKLVDFDDIFHSTDEVIGFEFEEINVIRLYI